MNTHNTKIVSEYDQEIPQSQTADNPVGEEPLNHHKTNLEYKIKKNIVVRDYKNKTPFMHYMEKMSMFKTPKMEKKHGICTNSRCTFSLCEQSLCRV